MASPAASFREPLHILGAGSIGMLWAASIRTALPSYPVTLLLRDHHRTRLKDHLDIAWRRPHHEQQQATKLSLPIQFLDDEDDPEKISTLVLTTKAYQAKDAVQSVLDRLDPSSSKIVVLCNGALSVRDELSKILDNTIPVPLVLATTTHGAYQEENNSDNDTTVQLFHAGVGKTFVEEGSEDLAKLWDSVGLHCQSIPSADMNALLWKKLAANCVINPLTALFQCTNGELLMQPAFPELQHELLQELAQVAQAAETHHTDDDVLISEESLRQFVLQVIQDTRDNKSSMYQDVLKKQRTEVDHLNGYVVRKGRELGVDCPANEEMYQRIREVQGDK
jgi:2-dehydropantoate 2-reductase